MEPGGKAHQSDSHEEWERRLVAKATAALRQYHEGASSWTVFNALLDGVTDITGSQYGYLARVIPHQGKLVLLVKAITTIGWTPEMANLVIPDGFTFPLEEGPQRLYGMSWRQRAPFICNHPPSSPYSCGQVPPGHPPINHFMEVPIFWGDQVVGVLGLANRAGGFTPQHAAWLQGFLSMVSTLMKLYQTSPPTQSSSSSPSAPEPSSTTPTTSKRPSSTCEQSDGQDQPSHQQRSPHRRHSCAYQPVMRGEDFDSREICHAVLDSIGEGVIVVDTNLRLQHVNNGAVHILGYDRPRSLLSCCRALSDVIPYFDDERAMDWSCFIDGQQKMLGAHVTTHARSRDGGLLSIDLSLSSFVFQRQRYFTAVFSDISQKKKSLERNKFLAFLSHEIRNPLQAIISGLQVLRAEWTEREQDSGEGYAQNMMDIMQRATHIIHRVIDDIVDFTRIEHRFVLKREEFEVRAMLRTAVETAKRTEWYKAGVDVVLDVERSVPRRAFCDYKRVEQVLMHLLTNALKYTAKGTVVVRCRLETQRPTSCEMQAVPMIHPEDEVQPIRRTIVGCSGGGERCRVTRMGGESGEEDDCEEHREGDDSAARYLCIDVEDTGIGISKEDQQNLFSVYTHIDGPSYLFSERTGLGLAITKRLCTVMGGNLWCRSELGKGSTFKFHVPCEPAPTDDDSTESESPQCPEASEQRQELESPRSLSPTASSATLLARIRAHLRGLRVLVVDDNSLMRKTMNAILSKERCIVTLAENGQQAIDIVKQNRDAFDVMLIDCLMPVKDGYRTVAELRTDGIQTPMIAITGNSLSEQKQQCRQVGFDTCLLKPVQKTELFSTIHHYTSRSSSK